LTEKRKNIEIRGARVHNLKNISVDLPRNRFIVITGLSGSGKSSLAFDTLYADGQRRYVESLSSYARQFMGRMSKPEVDSINGISPAIAIEQKVNTRNPRSTVGTSTEIYEYIKLLYARIGKTYSPISGKEVKRDKVSDIINFIDGFEENTKFIITSSLENTTSDRSPKEDFDLLMQQGFSRLLCNDKIHRIDEVLEKNNIDKLKKWKKADLVIDRLVKAADINSIKGRLADSIQTAFYEGKGYCNVYKVEDEKLKKHHFSNKFELDGISFHEPNTSFFSFNNPMGACQTCEGYGSVIGIDEDLVIPDKSLSIYEDAVACWKGEKMSQWKQHLILKAPKFDFPIHKPYNELSDTEKETLWKGNKYFEGIDDFFKEVERNTYKIQYRVMLSRHRGRTVCPDCRGTRLRKETNYVQINNTSISDIILMPIDESIEFFNNLKLEEWEAKVAKNLLTEIKTRLKVLCEVGLGYLNLNRKSSTLSGGESQRINLATSLGSSLVGSMYILDEPSIGLHPRDTHRLIKVLKELRDKGNTVIVVEHEEEIIKAADYIVDLGPEAGSNGGKIVFNGTYNQLLKQKNNLTSDYLQGVKKIAIPHIRRNWKDYIEVKGAEENNLKSINVKFPLNALSVVTGVSGSGKTTLVKSILYPALSKIKGSHSDKSGKHKEISGDLKAISQVEMIDQNPIGKSSRSNPVTYIKAFDDIRDLFASQKLAKVRGYKPGHFSFNVDGGRCEYCKGEGSIKIEMQFMADINLKCDECDGKRYKKETLDVKYRDVNISDILEMTVDDAVKFFSENSNTNTTENRIINKLQTLAEVGMGYVKLGQSSNTLSGGEAQRIKLAFYLSKGSEAGKILFIFDEPTTGLHFHDINKLYKAMNALVKNGHTVIVIEHNQEIIKCADWIIDLGPEGGKEGGNLIFEGIPEDLVKSEKSYTAEFLRNKI
jgi:excinuclease ABC subunit A